MEIGESGLEFGPPLGKDAVGTWHPAQIDGVPCTLRILREDLEGREDACLLMREEIRRIARIDHPALLRVRGVQQAGPRPWFITDPIDGPNLETLVSESGPLAPGEALELACTLAAAFGYLEGRRQVHAAPVPARVVRVADAWRLLTFRDVRAWDELKTLKGRPYPDATFAPPERARAHPAPLLPHPFVSWALGSLLGFAAGGGAPRLADGSWAAPTDALPADLADMVRRLTDEVPARRLQGPRAIEALLRGEAHLSDQPDTAPAASKPIQAPVPRRMRKRR